MYTVLVVIDTKEFRKNLKTYLDHAISGEDVIIRRSGVMFHINAEPFKLEELDAEISSPKPTKSERSPDEPSVRHSPPKPENQVTSEKNIKFCKHNQVVGFCKQGCR